jgi:hypothetical protein
MIFCKQVIYREDTKETIIIDERVFSHCVENQLKIIREKAKELILEIAPEHKQRNAALGLLSQEETEQLKTSIQNIRNTSNQKEQEILSVIWDGTEQNRPIACDSVQKIRWD